jgi:hypothetical protein
MWCRQMAMGKTKPKTKFPKAFPPPPKRRQRTAYQRTGCQILPQQDGGGGEGARRASRGGAPILKIRAKLASADLRTDLAVRYNDFTTEYSRQVRTQFMTQPARPLGVLGRLVTNCKVEREDRIGALGAARVLSFTASLADKVRPICTPATNRTADGSFFVSPQDGSIEQRPTHNQRSKPG